MEVLVKAAQFFLSLSILVILHEFGHFAFAKLFKTRVEKFYLFFDPWFSIFKFKRGETEYGMGWLPLGGYVKISGMIDESMDKEQLKQPPQPHEFRAKKTWQRLLIMIGGVMVNFLLAIFIYAMILWKWGDAYLPTDNVKYGITCDSLALEMGLKNGDKILTVDHVKIEDFSDIIPEIVLTKAKTIQVMRDGQKTNIDLPDDYIPKLLKSRAIIAPRFPFIADTFTKESAGKAAGLQQGDRLIRIDSVEVEYFDQFRSNIMTHPNDTVSIGIIRDGKELDIEVIVPESGLIGVYPVGSLSEFFELKHTQYTFLQAIPAGIDRGISTLRSYLRQLKLIFEPQTKAYESLGGFITIGSIFPGVWDWQAFWSLTAFLSIILAIMNILPIPALDGGHVTFLLYEMVTGRKPSDKFLEYAQITGMIILLSLLIFANGNDVVKLFQKWF